MELLSKKKEFSFTFPIFSYRFHIFFITLKCFFSLFPSHNNSFLCAHLEVPNDVEIEIFHSWNVLIELELNGLSINESQLRDLWNGMLEVGADCTGIFAFNGLM